MNIKQIGEPSKIKSSAFEIREVSNQAQKYFAYYKKNGMSQDLDNYLALDLNFTHNCKNLRKYIKEANGHNFYAFEYVGEYKTLRDLYKPKEEIILRIASDIVSALMVLHSNYIIGRCFNIDNIILVNGQTPILMEFGYYPKMDYQVPEIVCDIKMNEKIDIFLLGRVLYYLTVGKELPIYTLKEFGNLEETINLAIAETNYSQHLKLFMQGLLQKNRQQRIDFLKLSQKFDNLQNSKLLCFYQNDFAQFSTKINDQLQLRQEFEAKLLESGPFLIENDSKIISQISQIQKKGPQIVFNKKIEVSEVDLNPPQSPDISDDGDGLLPPIVDVDEKFEIDNKIMIQSDKINKELFNILPIYFDTIEGNEEIWNRIFFSLYRFGLLKKLSEMIQNFKKLSDDLSLWKGCFALSKISIVLKQELVNDLSKDKNIFFIDEQQWKEFILKDKDYKRMKLKLQQDLNQEKQVFQGLTFNQLQRGYQIFNQQFPQNDFFLNNNLKYEIFEQYKIPYREILSENLNFFESLKGKEVSLLKLLLLMCIKINNICDFNQIQINYQYVNKILHQEINSIVQLEFFFQNQREHEFDQYFRTLKDMYFPQDEQ